jgi:drug/metabolite transporter (DMT)-like permease
LTQNVATNLSARDGTGGIAFMVAGCFLVTLNDAILKWLTVSYPVGQIMFVRSLFVFLPIVVLALHEGGLANLRVHNLRGQAVRAAIVVLGMFLFVTGISLMPLADALAIAFASPLMATALAVPMLGEKVGWRRWTAVCVGMAGVVVIIRPTGEGLAWAALLPLGSALTGALRDIVTRKLSVSDSSSSILLVTTIAVMIAGLASALADPLLGWTAVAWQAMSFDHVAMLGGAGVLLAGGQYCMIEAVRRSEVGLVAPFKYTSMIWAVLTGFLIYGIFPDLWIIAGSALVVASGLYILQRERTLKTARRSIPDRPDSAPLS